MEPIPFAELMGIEIVSAAPEKVVGRLTVRDEICTRPAVLHGGAAMAFADTLGAIATVLNLPEGHWTTTIESKTNFLSAAPSGSVVTGECTPVHRGRRTMVWQTRIYACRRQTGRAGHADTNGFGTESAVRKA